MSRSERRAWFDRLCELRDAYRDRGSDDATGVMSIAEIVGWATQRLDEAAHPAATLEPPAGPGRRPA